MTTFRCRSVRCNTAVTSPGLRRSWTVLHLVCRICRSRGEYPLLFHYISFPRKKKGGGPAGRRRVLKLILPPASCLEASFRVWEGVKVCGSRPLASTDFCTLPYPASYAPEATWQLLSCSEWCKLIFCPLKINLHPNGFGGCWYRLRVLGRR